MSAPELLSESPSEPAGRRRSFGRLLTGSVVVVLLAAIAALAVTLLSTRDDLHNEKAKMAQVQAATTTTATPPEAGVIGPVTPSGQNDLTDLQHQLDQVNAALLQAKNDLRTEQDARAADAAAQTQQVADLQARITQLQGMFPVTAAALAAADATGQYAVAVKAGECTLADCTPLSAFAIQFTDATHVTGDRAKGVTTFDGSQSTLSGTVDPSLAPMCSGQTPDVSYALALHVTAVDLVDGKLRVTRLAGTYTETIVGATATGAPCAGQHRTYTLDLTRQ